MGAYVSRFVPSAISNAVSKKPSEVSVLNAIEDIQKLSQDDIHEEFDRIFQHMRQGLNRVESSPCSPLAHRLLHCIRQNKSTTVDCFDLMDAYRSCIAETFQQHVEDYLRDHQDEGEPPQLPLEPPPTVAAHRKSGPWHSLRSWITSWFH